MKFDLPKENSSIIKVIGVGGGGSNAVNHMFSQGIRGVDFLVCNTDQQALDISPVPLKVQLGASLTEGRGAGSVPEVGKNCALENIDEIKTIMSKGTKMIFITAGMGGGTGTGAAPVIAKNAREMGILTVGIVTMPFFFEGRKRRQQAEEGIEDMRQNVDTLLIINNEKLREMCGNLPIAQAFAMADNVLTTAAKGIAEIITRTGYINVDFEDVRTVMKESGVAIMGSASASGENRSIKAVEKALASPLLNDNNIQGARYVLLNITFGNQEVLMDEISDITDFIQEEAGASADVIWGYGMDEQLGDEITVTIIATGFKQNPHTGVNTERNVEMRKVTLEEKSSPPKPAPAAPASTEPFLVKDRDEKQPAITPPLENQRIIEFELPQSVVVPSSKDAASRSTEELAEESTLDEERAEEPTQEIQPFMRRVADAQTEEAAPKSVTPAGPVQNADREMQAKTQGDRFSRLRELSMRMRTPGGMADLENEPAFKRKSISLDDVPSSGDSVAGKLSISEEEGEDGQKKTRIRPNNSFWHDKPD